MWSAGGNKTVDGRGGFLDETYAGQQTQANKVEPTRGNSLVPLMIGHILQGSLETLTLWGTPIKLVCLVAYIRKVESVTTKVSYDIVDETGSIKAYQWIETADESGGPTVVPAGSYARFIGTAREVDGTRHVLILKIEPITSFSAVFHHLMEVSYVCLKAEELSGNEGSGAVQTAVKNEMEVDSCHGMDKDQAAVFIVIQTCNNTDTGIHKNDLKSKLSPNVKDKLDEILEFLTCEGHVYTTCTDDHFKTT